MEATGRTLPHDANHNHMACDSIADQFDYFSQIPLESAQIGCADNYFRPMTGVNSSGPFVFNIESHADSFLKLSSIYLYAKYKVVKADGTDLAADDDVSLVNNFANSMWRQCQISLNNNEWNGANAVMSNYKSYLETILSYEDSARDTHLKSGIFCMDTPGKFDTHATNTGYIKRKAFIAESKPFDCVCPLTHDFLRSKNHLMPGQTLTITLNRASDEFVLLTGSANKFKVEILDLRLYAERIQVAPEVIDKVMKNPPFKMLGNRTEIKTFALPAGLTEKTLTLISGGTLPKTIVVGQVDTTAMHGEIKTNPFNFKHNDINKIGLRVNGNSVPR